MQVQDWSGQTWLGKLVPVEENVPDMTFHGVLPVMCHVVAVHLPLSRLEVTDHHLGSDVNGNPDVT